MKFKSTVQAAVEFVNSIIAQVRNIYKAVVDCRLNAVHMRRLLSRRCLAGFVERCVRLSLQTTTWLGYFKRRNCTTKIVGYISEFVVVVDRNVAGIRT